MSPDASALCPAAPRSLANLQSSVLTSHCIALVLSTSWCCPCRKWRLISHADTINPFLASLVNHESKIKLTPIALGNQTLIEWQGTYINGLSSRSTKHAAMLL